MNCGQHVETASFFILNWFEFNGEAAEQEGSAVPYFKLWPPVKIIQISSYSLVNIYDFVLT